MTATATATATLGRLRRAAPWPVLLVLLGLALAVHSAAALPVRDLPLLSSSSKYSVLRSLEVQERVSRVPKNRIRGSELAGEDFKLPTPRLNEELHRAFGFAYGEPASGGLELSRDPIGFAGGMNLYAYTGNNPVNLTDPTGLMGGPRVTTLEGQEAQRRDVAAEAAYWASVRTREAYGRWDAGAVGLSPIADPIGLPVDIARGLLSGPAYSLLSAGERVAPSRLGTLFSNYWERSTVGLTVDEAREAARRAGFGFEIGRCSRFENARNAVVISKANLSNGLVNRMELAEELQHGLDRAMSAASDAVRRGISNEQFHAEVFGRILNSTMEGGFSFLGTEDVFALNNAVRELLQAP